MRKAYTAWTEVKIGKGNYMEEDVKHNYPPSKLLKDIVIIFQTHFELSVLGKYTDLCCRQIDFKHHCSRITCIHARCGFPLYYKITMTVVQG